MAFDKKYTAASTQTIFDLALQLYGNVDSVFDMINASPELENITSDPTGKTINYSINNTVAQTYFINKEISVSTKPISHYNSLDDSLKVDDYFLLLQENGYKILL